jgi:hemerythrin
VTWNPAYAVGIEIIDNQHKNILALCNALADFVIDDMEHTESCADTVSHAHDELGFRNGLRVLMDQAREHFSTEEKLLNDCAYPLLDELKNEYDEFAYLTKEILTQENFEAIEVQRFLVLWWVGHIAAFAKNYRSAIAPR